jgi:alpha-L-arabinofuranosidase
MFGVTRIYSSISNNPTMRVNARETMGILQLTASHDQDGNAYLMVVNSHRTDDVTALIDLAGSQDFASVDTWTLNGESYASYNTILQPNRVSIKEDTLPY